MSESPLINCTNRLRKNYLVYSIYPVHWLVSFNQIHETDRIDQIDQMNKTDWQDFFSILLEQLEIF